MATWKVLHPNPTNPVLDDMGLKTMSMNSCIQVNPRLTSNSVHWNGRFLLFIERPETIKPVVYIISIALQSSSLLPCTQQT